MMKITVVGSLPPQKGISQYIMGYLSGLEHYADVQIVSFRHLYPSRLYPGGSVVRDDVASPAFEKIRIDTVLDRYNPMSRIRAGHLIQGEVVHFQYRTRYTAPIYLTVLLIAKYRKKRRIAMTVHNVVAHESSRWSRMVDRILFYFVDKFIVHSEANKDTFLCLYGSQKIVAVFPHGVIQPSIQGIAYHDARRQLGIGPQKRVMLCYGTVRPYKGIETAIRALGHLKEVSSEYFLLIAGKTRGSRERYQSLIDDLGVKDFVLRKDYFLSEEEQAVVFSSADILLLPYTHFDAQSGVLALNFSFGLPAIISDLPGLQSVIDDPSMTFPQGDDKALAGVIHRVFADGMLPEKSKRLKQLAEKYSRNTIAQATLSFLKK